jgi:hypothetical protein
MKNRTGILAVLALFLGIVAPSLFAQNSSTLAPDQPNASKVWVGDRGDGRYRNPILYADYSDPNAIRVDDDSYLVAG